MRFCAKRTFLALAFPNWFREESSADEFIDARAPSRVQVTLRCQPLEQRNPTPEKRTSLKFDQVGIHFVAFGLRNYTSPSHGTVQTD